MVRGVGIDVVEVERIRQVLARHGARFLQRVMTAEELAGAPPAPDKAPYFAGRWAAKEAISKALGTGIGASCLWTDMSIRNHPSGQPYLILSGAAARTAARLHIRTFHISISHLKDIACACAVAESD
jgi:holo-[acyl-carrier protein] synthase